MSGEPRAASGAESRIGALTGSLVALAMAPVRFVRWLADWLRWWGATQRRRLTVLVIAAAVVLATLVTRIARLELRYEAAHLDRAAAVETVFLPPHDVLRLMALGHEAFAADLLFLQANAYFVRHLFHDRIFTLLPTYLDAVIALDPDNPRVYEWASQAVKFGQFIGNDTLELSNDYSRRGLERFPDHWRFYLDIGFNYLIEWKPKDAAERAALRARALEYFAVAAALPGSQLDPNFVSNLYYEDNDVEMALLHATLRYWEASDAERESLRSRLAQFGSAATAQRLAALEVAWKRDYPYVPISLFELVGDKQAAPLPSDWARPDALPLAPDDPDPHVPPEAP